MSAMCKDAEKLCQPQIERLEGQWTTAKFPLDKVEFFGEQPDLHMRIEAFFSGIKSLLDLLVQLLSSEKIVAAALHGFHRDGNVYGGSVLKSLRNNVPKDRKELAGKIAMLLTKHKDKWIDRAIRARDDLVHPKRGMAQLMFQFEGEERDGKLVFIKINAPTIDSLGIDRYANLTLQRASSFAAAFIALVQGTAMPSSSGL
jgi:hypothetical protein